MPAGVQEAQQRGDYYGPRDQARDQSRRERERDWERDRRGGPPSGPRSQQQQQHGGGRRGGDRYGGRDHYSGNNSGNNNRRYGGRGGGGLSGTSFANLRFLAANRPILTQTQSADSYNGHGHGNGNGNGNGIMSHDFVKDNKAGTTYLNLDDLSDSDEAEMSMSGGDGGEGGAQPPRKRARVDKDDAAAAAAATPKWSNPDPYTVLPPTTETGSKKKDVVHLIRKARVKGERAAAVASEDTEEFISCGLDSDDDGVHDDGGGDAAAGAATDGRVVGAGEGSGSGGGRIGRSGRMANGVRDASAGGEGRPTNSKNKNATSLPNAANAVNTVNTVNTNNSRNPPAHAPVGPRAQQQRQSSLSVELNTSRKRTHDDELRPLLLPEHAILKKATKMPAGGVILPGWQVKPNEPPCPWLVVPAAADAADTVDTTHMGVWLHREMMDFYEFLRPRTFEQALRQALLDDLAGLVRRRFGNGRIHCFGSFMSGLYLPTGDMDIVMCSTQFLSNRPALFNSKKHLFKFGRFLCDSQLAEREHLEHITRAKVPLVKYIDTKTGLKVDVSFENMTGVAANETFARWKAQFPEMPLLVTLIKQLLTMRGLNEPVNGGIGGFSIICLVVSMLQLMPPVQTGAMTGENHLGDLLMHFLDLYGNKFNYETTAISLNPPGYTPKVVPFLSLSLSLPC